MFKVVSLTLLVIALGAAGLAFRARGTGRPGATAKVFDRGAEAATIDCEIIIRPRRPAETRGPRC